MQSLNVEAYNIAPAIKTASQKAAVDACGSLNLSDEIKTKLSKAVGKAIDEATSYDGTNQEVAVHAMRAVEELLVAEHIKGLTDDMEKNIQKLIETELAKNVGIKINYGNKHT